MYAEHSLISVLLRVEQFPTRVFHMLHSPSEDYPRPRSSQSGEALAVFISSLRKEHFPNPRDFSYLPLDAALLKRPH